MSVREIRVEAGEAQRLAAMYAEFSDGELIRFGRGVGDLTETAQAVLRAELARRELDVPSEDMKDEPEEAGLESALPGDFAAISAPECVWEFAEVEDARAAAEMLGAAGLEYDLLLPDATGFTARSPRLAVLPENVERVREMLANPIPEEFRELVRTRERFIVPVCVACGAPDPLLESIEPSNEWRCEVCGHVWRETVPE